MAGEIVKWLNGEVRQHGKELDRIYRSEEVAEAHVSAVGAVTRRATAEVLQINMLRAQAEHIAPDGAELYAMLAVAGTVEMAHVISRMNRPGR